MEFKNLPRRLERIRDNSVRRHVFPKTLFLFCLAVSPVWSHASEHATLSPGARLIIEEANKTIAKDIERYCTSPEKITAFIAQTARRLSEEGNLDQAIAMSAGMETANFYPSYCRDALVGKNVASARTVLSRLSEDAKSIVSAVDEELGGKYLEFCQSGKSGIVSTVTEVATRMAEDQIIDESAAYDAGYETVVYYPVLCFEVIADLTPRTPPTGSVGKSESPDRKILAGLNGDARAIIAAANEEMGSKLVEYCRKDNGQIWKYVTKATIRLAEQQKINPSTAQMAGAQTARYYPAHCRVLLIEAGLRPIEGTDRKTAAVPTPSPPSGASALQSIFAGLSPEARMIIAAANAEMGSKLADYCRNDNKRIWENLTRVATKLAEQGKMEADKARSGGAETASYYPAYCRQLLIAGATSSSPPVNVSAEISSASGKQKNRMAGNALKLPVFGKIPNEEKLTASEETTLQILRKESLSAWAAKSIDPMEKPKSLVQGSRNIYRITVTKSLFNANRAFLAGDGTTALRALSEEEKTASTDSVKIWYMSHFRARVLIMMGRAADALEELKTTARLERGAFGMDVGTRALTGEAKIWLGDYEAAELDLARLTAAIGSWRMPTEYSTVPSNIAALVNLVSAQVRALTGLAITRLMRGDHKKAAMWADIAERRMDAAFVVAQHPIYRHVMPVEYDMYYGRGTNYAVLGAVAIIGKGQRSAVRNSFLRSAKYFDAIDFRMGGLTVDAFRAYALLKAGRLDEAVKVGEMASDKAAIRGLADMVWCIQAITGEALLADGNPDQAEISFRRAQAAMDSASGSLATDHAKRRFGVSKETITYRLAQLDAARKDFGQLFLDLERGRARAFIDTLANRPIAAGDTWRIVDRIRDTDKRIRVQRLTSGFAGSEDEVQTVNQLLSARKHMVKELHDRNADLAAVFSVSVQKLSDIRALLKQGEVMIYPLPARGIDKERLLRIDQRGASVLDLDKTRDSLVELLKKFTHAVSLNDPKKQSSVANELSRVLKKPLNK